MRDGNIYSAVVTTYHSATVNAIGLTKSRVSTQCVLIILTVFFETPRNRATTSITTVSDYEVCSKMSGYRVRVNMIAIITLDRMALILSPRLCFRYSRSFSIRTFSALDSVGLHPCLPHIFLQNSVSASHVVSGDLQQAPRLHHPAGHC